MRHFQPPANQPAPIDPIVGRAVVVTTTTIAVLIILIGWVWELQAPTDMETRAESRLSLFYAHQSLTNWFQTSMLFLGGFLCLIMSATTLKVDRASWSAVAGLLAYLSMSEQTNIDHEISITMLSSIAGRDVGYPVLIGLISAICIALWFAIRSLVQRTHSRPRQLAAAYLIFVAGAVGLESVANVHVFVAAAEESLETIGVTLFVNSMVCHLSAPAKATHKIYF